jgi:hypothetical protein
LHATTNKACSIANFELLGANKEGYRKNAMFSIHTSAREQDDAMRVETGAVLVVSLIEASSISSSASRLGTNDTKRQIGTMEPRTALFYAPLRQSSRRCRMQSIKLSNQQLNCRKSPCIVAYRSFELLIEIKVLANRFRNCQSIYHSTLKFSSIGVFMARCGNTFQIIAYKCGCCVTKLY